MPASGSECRLSEARVFCCGIVSGPWGVLSVRSRGSRVVRSRGRVRLAPTRPGHLRLHLRRTEFSVSDLAAALRAAAQEEKKTHLEDSRREGTGRTRQTPSNNLVRNVSTVTCTSAICDSKPSGVVYVVEWCCSSGCVRSSGLWSVICGRVCCCEEDVVSSCRLEQQRRSLWPHGYGRLCYVQGGSRAFPKYTTTSVPLCCASLAELGECSYQRRTERFSPYRYR